MRRAWSSVGSVLEALRHWSKLQGANAFHFLIGSFVQLARDASFIRSWKASFVDWLAIKSHRGAGWLRFEIEQVLKQQRAAAKAPPAHHASLPAPAWRPLLVVAAGGLRAA